MANVRNTVTDTYQGETIQCAEFVVDNTLEFFRVCPLNESGDYAFQMVAKSTVNGKRVIIFLHDAYHVFTLTTEWQFYSYVFKDVVIEDGDHMEIMFRDTGTFRIYHSKLEKGNKITGWNEADYDTRAVAEGIEENIYIPNTKEINGQKLGDNTVTANKIYVADLYALNADIAGWKIDENEIESVKSDTETFQGGSSYTEFTYDGEGHVTSGTSYYSVPNKHRSSRLSHGKLIVGHRTGTTIDSQSTNDRDVEYATEGMKLVLYDSDGSVLSSTKIFDVLDDRIGIPNLDVINLFVSYINGGVIRGYNIESTGNISTFGEMVKKNVGSSAIANTYWHDGSLVCGHGESASISSHTGGNATITIPTDEIGSNPVINFTKYNYSDDVWLNSINTSGTNTIINVGVYNGGSSARTVKFDYMIAKHS